jgi:two-component system, NtrC family, sensor kinase
MITRLQHARVDELVERIESLQHEVERLRSQCEHMDRLATVGTVAAGVAHEINNLLTPALGYIELAERHPEDAALLRKTVLAVAAGVRSAAGIARAALDFASPCVDPAELDGSTCNISDAVNAALQCVGREPARQGIRCEVDVDPSLHAAINPLGLQHVVLNLVINAIAAMAGRPLRRLGIFAQRAGDGVVLRVSDTGPGIPKAIRRQIFEPFARAGRASCDACHGEPGGRGLGLAVCRMILARAGGEISVESSSESGTTFKVKLRIPNKDRTLAADC